MFKCIRCFRSTMHPFKRFNALIYITFVILLVLLSLSWLGKISFTNDISTPYQGEHPTESSTLGPLNPPDDYAHLHEQSSVCEHRLGVAYLSELRSTRATYCSAQSISRLTCFHSQTDKGQRIDSFCLGREAKFDKTSQRIQLSCDPVEPFGVETGRPSLPLSEFTRYWYGTGPRIIIDDFIGLAGEQPTLPRSQGAEGFTILVKREGAGNLWHSLMEIMALAMTLDVLQMSPQEGKDGRAFLRQPDASNTQVVILDNHVDGSYFDLWRLFARKPTIRLSELPDGTDIDNVIIPLAGGGNPVWQSDWEPNNCDHSELLRTFSHRVLRHLHISDDEVKDKVVVTIIDRLGTRKLLDIEGHTTALKDRYLHVEIQTIDLAALPFSEQVRIVRNSDVLAGVHGAGLTHGLWLKQGSALAEILPDGFEHKGFRNMAGALGHGYFSVHGAKASGPTSDWQQDDVTLENDRFLELMDIAIKSVYNRGTHNFDISE